MSDEVALEAVEVLGLYDALKVEAVFAVLLQLGLAAPMRERGRVQLEEYREDGLYLEGIVKTEDLHCFEGYLL